MKYCLLWIIENGYTTVWKLRMAKELNLPVEQLRSDSPHCPQLTCHWKQQNGTVSISWIRCTSLHVYIKLWINPLSFTISAEWFPLLFRIFLHAWLESWISEMKRFLWGRSLHSKDFLSPPKHERVKAFAPDATASQTEIWCGQGHDRCYNKNKVQLLCTHHTHQCMTAKHFYWLFTNPFCLLWWYSSFVPFYSAFPPRQLLDTEVGVSFLVVSWMFMFWYVAQLSMSRIGRGRRTGWACVSRMLVSYLLWSTS